MDVGQVCVRRSEAASGTALVNVVAASARTRLTAAEAGGFPGVSTSAGHPGLTWRPKPSRGLSGYEERTAIRAGVVPEAAADPPTAVHTAAAAHETAFSSGNVTPSGVGSA